MWGVELTGRAAKAAKKLPLRVQTSIWHLVRDLKMNGPVAGKWPNYGKLDNDRHHCHLKKGRPTYVAVWRETGEDKSIEVTYVGTHEGAPY
jgi:hypothetical protein